MPDDYKKMYHELFSATTSAIVILQQAQLRAEEIFINEQSTPLRLLKIEPIKEDQDNELNFVQQEHKPEAK